MRCADYDRAQVQQILACAVCHKRIRLDEQASDSTCIDRVTGLFGRVAYGADPNRLEITREESAFFRFNARKLRVGQCLGKDCAVKV